MSKSDQRARNFCFTINNYTEEEENSLKGVKGMKYIIVGQESGDSGTKHLQGYIQFKDAKTINSLKKVNNRAHWEIARGTPDQASAYCKKEGSFWEEGELGTGQGFRTDLEDARTLIENGANQQEVANNNFFLWIQYGRRLEEYRTIIQPKRTWKSQVIIYWGESGSGKSHRAFELFPAAARLSYQHPFMLGYNNEDTVIMEEFDPATMPVSTFLEINDKYPKKINVKGSEKEWNPQTIIYTSNIDPRTWYGDNEFRIQRRFDEVWFFFMLQ